MNLLIVILVALVVFWGLRTWPRLTLLLCLTVLGLWVCQHPQAFNCSCRMVNAPTDPHSTGK